MRCAHGDERAHSILRCAAGTLSAINIGVTVFILYTLARVGRVVAARVAKRREELAEAQEARDLALMSGGAVAPSDGAADAPLLGRV